MALSYMRRERGRPRKPDADGGVVVGFKISAATKEQLDVYCQKMETKYSEVCRRALKIFLNTNSLIEGETYVPARAD